MKKNGFSLIELMVAIAIVGILAAIAYPSYQNHIIKGHRAAAQSHILELASAQTDYINVNRVYAGGVAALNKATPAEVSDYYTITITNVDNTASPPTFTINATPKAGTIQENDGVLSVNHLGIRTGTW